MIPDTSAQDRLLERSRGRRRWLWGGIAATVVAISTIAAPGVARLLSASGSVSASRLSFATVERGPFVRDIAAGGRVVAAVSPTMYADSAGAVTLKVHPGDTVTRGQVLAVIESPELANELAQERAALDAMNVDYRRAEIDASAQRLKLQEAYDSAAIDAKAAQRELERTRQAFTEGAVPQRDVSRAEDELEKAELALKHAKSHLDLDENGLALDVEAKKLARDRQALRVEELGRRVDALTVRSPVDGQVGQLFVPARATVPKGAELLSVIDLSALEVEVTVPESFARDLAPGMRAEVAGDGRAWQGIVNAISPEVVAGEVAARLRFDEVEPPRLRQNQRLSVRIVLDHRDNVLTVTRGAFVNDSGGRHAYVVHDGFAVMTPIRLGASAIDKVEILEGLKVGDRIVISGTENFNGAARMAISR